MRPTISTIVWLMASWLVAAKVEGQMFGSRAGGMLGQGVKDSASVGTVNFNERFIRGNRRPDSFVGGDSRDRRGFVGSQRGGQTGRPRPAISGILGSTAPDANRTAVPAGGSRSGPYEPRLAVGFNVIRPPEEAVAQGLARLLRASPEFHSTSRIEVSVEGAIATLRGEVASERDRTLAEKLVLFEPGIDSVRNELKVRNPSAGPLEHRPSIPSTTDQKDAGGRR
jgi:hypothetical protein